MTTAQRPVLCILVDAVRHDYVDARRTPVLARVAAERGFARMRPILGYSDSIRATIFTARYPADHGYWMEYCYRPESSPFSALQRLRAVDRVPSDFVRRGTKYVLSRALMPRVERAKGYRHLSLRHFPLHAVSQFDWTLRAAMTEPGALGAPTLFEHLSAEGVPWSYLDASQLGRRGLARALDVLPRETAFVFVYLHQVDMASHVFGIESQLFARAVTRTDALVDDVTGRVRRRLGEPELIVFSDHGMSPVRRIVSYPRLWRDPDFPRRFVVALDATMVRVWWVDADDALRDRIRAEVAEGAPGRFLDRAELVALHLDFAHRLYGDEIYLLEEGDAIFPNFHSMLRPRAMHAYHPDGLDQHGILLGGGGGEQAELVDIAPLLLELLGQPSDALRRATATMPSASGGATRDTPRESARTARTPSTFGLRPAGGGAQ